MYYNNYGYNNAGDRQLWFPFLLGGLGGAAVVSATRPRPVYAVNSAPYQAAPYQVYGQYPPAGYNYYGGYNYYPPYYR